MQLSRCTWRCLLEAGHLKRGVTAEAITAPTPHSPPTPVATAISIYIATATATPSLTTAIATCPFTISTSALT